MGKFRSIQGYTLLEILVVVVIVGILSAIAAPSWLEFLNRQKLNAGVDRIYWAMRSAQSNAKRDKITWQVSFREENSIVQWSVHPAESQIFIPDDLQWNNLNQDLEIYKDKNNKGVCETTLAQPTRSCPTIGPWRVQFNYKGNPNGQIGQITLTNKNSSKLQRCVYVSTLIGNLRNGKNHPKANGSKKYCY
ncbi:MAG: prepilin-type N-terminal cleavage/methylation domain-containing protein [Oscillatoria sp. PMC 1068.18]|nr:prepilin-type N-terminal cleavage/methylation domain-containing protein [Oscillatoria sp. PMC 1076.18]MEC4989538.1 prepilin-type N-terminal cleavage/methylation domain-containing protein [Oscillatoria sp. PMC 1068.18]